MSKIDKISSIVELTASSAEVLELISSFIFKALLSSSLFIFTINSPSKVGIFDKGSVFIFLYSVTLLFHLGCSNVRNSITIGKVLKNLFSIKEFI